MSPSCLCSGSAKRKKERTNQKGIYIYIYIYIYMVGIKEVKSRKKKRDEKGKGKNRKRWTTSSHVYLWVVFWLRKDRIASLSREYPIRNLLWGNKIGYLGTLVSNVAVGLGFFACPVSASSVCTVTINTCHV